MGQAVRKHIDYDSVFAPAPHLESARMFRAFEVLLIWNAVDFDINQAYLIGKADSDQHPAGLMLIAHGRASILPRKIDALWAQLP